MISEAFKHQQSPHKSSSTSPLFPSAICYSTYAENYPNSARTALYKWANNKKNSRTIRSAMETLIISPDVKIAFDQSRSLPSKCNLERVLEKAFKPTLDLWGDALTNDLSVTQSNGWYSSSASNSFDMMEDLLSLRRPFLSKATVSQYLEQQSTRTRSHVHGILQTFG